MLSRAADIVTLTREELYEQVWSEPMWTLAQRYGISDVGLSKTCRRYKIPVPGRGYWQQKQAGQRLRPTPLPKLSASIANSFTTITLRVPKSLQVTQSGAMDLPIESTHEPPQIVVADVLTDPHSLVAHSVKALRRVKPTREGLFPRTPNADYLDVRVSLDTVDRTMRILDALLKALDERDVTIRIDVKEQRAITCAHILDEIVPFYIEERIEHVTVPPPMPRRPGDWVPQPEPKLVATGALEFHIDIGWLYESGNLRKSWRDGKKQRVEDCLGKIILGLFAAAEAIKANRLAREERERQWKEAERRRRYSAWESHQEKRRRDALHEELERWRLCQQLREYVDMRRARGAPANGDVERWTTWLDWLALYADRIENRLIGAMGPDPEPFDENAYYY